LYRDTKGITIDGFCEVPPLQGKETVYAVGAVRVDSP
jgi:hypothetical protein